MTLEPNQTAISALEAAIVSATTDIKRSNAAGRKPLPADKLNKYAAKARRYRKTGSTVGWQEEMK